MRKLSQFIVVVFSMYSVPALATDWVLIGSTSDFARHVDSSSVMQVGSFKRAWVRTDALKSSYEYQRMLHLNDYDCEERRYRNLQITGYRSNGESVTEPGNRSWSYPAPTSIAEAEINYVCSGRLP